MLTLHGRQFKDAALIVASPPCQEYSYMAMPWSRAKAIAAEYRSGARDVKKLTALFDACFRIQREAIEAAGHFIPLVVENVRGAIPWVGRSRWNYGSFHLWGDVPALMPMTQRGGRKVPDNNGPRRWDEREVQRLCDARKNSGGSWFNIGSPGQKVVAQNPDGRLINKRNGHGHARHLTNQREHDGLKVPGINLSQVGFNVAAAQRYREQNGTKNGNDWFGAGDNCSLQRKASSKSDSRKAASAAIAKIPLPLAAHIARAWMPTQYTAQQGLMLA